MAARKKQPTDEQAPMKPARKKSAPAVRSTTPRKRRPAAEPTNGANAEQAIAAEAPARSKGNKPDLVIVESPAKAKTINKYLGSNFMVLASYGHVRDLPKRRRKGEDVAGIDIDDGWVPTYVVEDKDDGKGKWQGKSPRSNGGRRRRSSPS